MGFEPTVACATTVFKTASLNHSDTSPEPILGCAVAACAARGVLLSLLTGCGGEEVSDVSSFFFEGDTYEVFSAYGSRKGKLADASSSLRVGYRELYYRVFDRGQERWP